MQNAWMRVLPAGGASSSPRLLDMIRWLIASDLPDDVKDCECTVVMLFKASVFLNYLTLGHATMTFSARSHLSRTTSRFAAQRFAWLLIAALIDAACGVLRGETEHCATAWDNHAKRRLGAMTHRRSHGDDIAIAHSNPTGVT